MHWHSSRRVVLQNAAVSGVPQLPQACVLPYTEYGRREARMEALDEAGAQVVSEIRAAGGEYTFVRCDVTSPMTFKRPWTR